MAAAFTGIRGRGRTAIFIICRARGSKNSALSLKLAAVRHRQERRTGLRNCPSGTSAKRRSHRMNPGSDIGGVRSAARVLTAPMTGVSDLPFRRAASKCGAAYVATEMVACETFAHGRPDVVRRAAIGEGLPLMVVQLVGREARWIAKGAAMAEAAGADIVDLNMGCPAKEVTGGLCGSALMRDLDQAERLIAAAVGATSRPVTLKMRLGWDDASRNAPELAPRAEAAGGQTNTPDARPPPQILKRPPPLGAPAGCENGAH